VTSLFVYPTKYILKTDHRLCNRKV